MFRPRRCTIRYAVANARARGKNCFVQVGILKYAVADARARRKMVSAEYYCSTRYIITKIYVTN